MQMSITSLSNLEKVNINNDQVKDELDQKILDAEKEINELTIIIQNYAKSRKEYQTECEKKTIILRDLYRKYITFLDKTIDFEKYFEKFTDFFDSMWFKDWEWGLFWWFDDYGQYYGHYKQYEKEKQDENYVKVNMQEIKWELVESLKDFTCNQIWRKISKLLHPDILERDNEIANNKDFLIFLKNLYTSLNNFNQKNDIWAMITAIQESWITYKDWNFVLPSVEQFQKGIIKIHKQKTLNDLLQTIQLIKSTGIYAYYLWRKNWHTDIILTGLDDEIQRLQDLLASYEQINNNG